MTTPNNWNQAVIEEFRSNSGKVGGSFTGKSLLLLHSVGAKSGQERINPVVCIADGDHLVIIASKGGAPTSPDWYYNILAHPVVTVEVGIEQFKAKAEIATEPERTRLYNKMIEMMSSFAEYQQKTTRTIPVIILTRMK